MSFTNPLAQESRFGAPRFPVLENGLIDGARQSLPARLAFDYIPDRTDAVSWAFQNPLPAIALGVAMLHSHIIVLAVGAAAAILNQEPVRPHEASHLSTPVWTARGTHILKRHSGGAAMGLAVISYCVPVLSALGIVVLAGAYRLATRLPNPDLGW